MTWGELAERLRRLPSCDYARAQGFYPAEADIWESAPATIAVYLVPIHNTWQLSVTAIDCATGRGRCNLSAEFLTEAAAQTALMTATKLVYHRGTP